MGWKEALIIGIAGSYLLAELYNSSTSRTEKRQWESFVKTHHGEAGVLMTLAGLLSKSPTLVGTGLGLAYHDRKDVNRWFK